MAVRDFESSLSESITVGASGILSTYNGQEEIHLAVLWKPESVHAGWIIRGTAGANMFSLNPFSDGFVWFQAGGSFKQAAPYTVGEWNLALMSIPAGVFEDELRSHYTSLDNPGWTHENEGTLTRPGAAGMTELTFGSNLTSEHLDGNMAVFGVWLDDAPWAPDASGDATIEAAGLDTSLQAWLDAAPKRVWAFNQDDVSEDVVDLMGSGDDQIAIDGTTVITDDDPPGFDFTLGGEPEPEPEPPGATDLWPWLWEMERAGRL